MCTRISWLGGCQEAEGAFAMAVMLHERGLFTWREWADRLAAEIPGARGRGEEDDGTRPGTVIFRGVRPSGAGWRSVCSCRRDPAR